MESLLQMSHSVTDSPLTGLHNLTTNLDVNLLCCYCRYLDQWLMDNALPDLTTPVTTFRYMYIVYCNHKLFRDGAWLDLSGVYSMAYQAPGTKLCAFYGVIECFNRRMRTCGCDATAAPAATTSRDENFNFCCAFMFNSSGNCPLDIGGLPMCVLSYIFAWHRGSSGQRPPVVCTGD